MNYLNLSTIQKMDIGITTLLFCIFITILRPLLIYQDINSRNIIAYTLIFFATYGVTLIFTNSFSFSEIRNKLENS